MNFADIADPNSFGKDSFVMFLGQVESVDDPKRSGRVKVRCIGWHPTDRGDGEGLSTEDLPWARTIMPVTHAQQMRVGGKHGLIAGSNVIGFFLDGRDAQQPVVIGSYNHTAKVTDENNRTKVDVGTGVVPDGVKGYTKMNTVADDDNSGILTKKEKEGGQDDPEDVSHDTGALEDSTDGECPIPPSAFSETKVEPLGLSNPHSQLFNVPVADGLCGGLMNSRGIIADTINELLPSGAGITVEGDDLFDINGNIININAIVNRLANLISGQLRNTINTQKAFLQKTVNKLLHSTGVGLAATRSPLTAQIADLTFSIQFDLFNAIIDIFVNSLEKIVKESVRSLYMQKLSSKFFDNLTGEGGSLGASVLLDLAPIEIADSVITDVQLGYELISEVAGATLETKSQEVTAKISALDTKISNINSADSDEESQYEGDDDMNDDISNSVLEITGDLQSMRESSEDTFNEINASIDGLLEIPSIGGIDLGEVSEFLQMVLKMDFTSLPTVFNRIGPVVLDLFTQEGCNPYDMYNTFNGFVGSVAGVGGQSFGGGSESGKSSKRDKDMYLNSGFAGKPGDSDLGDSTNSVRRGEPRVAKIGQSVRERIRSKSPSFAPVDFYEEGRVYDLNGEVRFDGVKTNNNTVLVNNQPDPSENGLYITSDIQWMRTTDSDMPSNMVRKKKVVVKSMGNKEGLFYYSGKNNPKLGFDDIKFLNLFASDEFTQEEKNAFDDTVRITPDGSKGAFFLASRPSGEEEAAKNFVNGIPNVAIISRPGKNYFFTSRETGRNYPSITIQGYAGTPIPVIDPTSGELVMVLTNPLSFNPKRECPSTAVFADDSSKGITTKDPNYDVFLSGFYIANSGTGYDKETTIKVIDKDRELETAEVKPRIRNGRITFIEIINNGGGFRRIPRIKIQNAGSGKGLKIYPMMGLRPLTENDEVKKIQRNVDLSFTPNR